MIDQDFASEFSNFLERNGRRPTRSAADLVAEWEDLISEVETGYPSMEAEYTNDLSVRDLLDRAMRDERLVAFEAQMAAIRLRVSTVDDRLRAQFLPGVEIGTDRDPWWRRGVLSDAGREYIKDIKKVYGIDILLIRERAERT
jgi:hypothetical protein